MRQMFMLISLVIVCSSCDSGLGTEVNYQISNAEVLKWAERLENDMEAGNGQAFADAIEFEFMADKIFSMEDIGFGKYLKNAQLIKSMKDGVKESMSDMGDQLLLGADSVIGYRMVRIYQDQGKSRCIFRLWNSDGLNYHDFEMLNVNGEAKAGDFVIMYTGEEFSKTLRDIFVQAGLFEDASEDSQSIKNLTGSEEIREHLNASEYESARARFEMMDSEYKKTKMMSLIDIEISSFEGDSAYLARLNAFDKQYPDDLAAEFLSLDRLWLSQDYLNVMKCIDRMDEKLGGDPFLDYYRASVLIDMEEYTKADGCLNKLAANGFSNFADYYYIQVLTQIGLGNYTQVIEHLDTLVDDFGYTHYDFMMSELAPQFMESQEFTSWIEANT